MLIWINLYFVMYIMLMLSLHYVLNQTICEDFNKKSLLQSHYFIVKYSKLKYIYLMIILSLAGLPPFILFFIKANYIITFIGNISIYSMFFVFISYFVNMIFYTQFFLYKNYSFDEIKYDKVKTKKLNISAVYKIIVLLVISTLGLVFCSDMYFIGNLFLV